MLSTSHQVVRSLWSQTATMADGSEFEEGREKKDPPITTLEQAGHIT